MTLPVEAWAEQVRAGNVRAVSRAITAIENHQQEAEALLRLLFPHTGQAYLTGVTGAPGTGKSTLVDRLAAYYRKKQEQVGVVAVDPTSPYSGGAILGDGIRMQQHFSDPGIYMPAIDREPYLAADVRAPVRESNYWLGSVVEGKQDLSGLVYMRNRYYDPRAGRKAAIV